MTYRRRLGNNRAGRGAPVWRWRAVVAAVAGLTIAPLAPGQPVQERRTIDPSVVLEEREARPEPEVTVQAVITPDGSIRYVYRPLEGGERRSDSQQPEEPYSELAFALGEGWIRRVGQSLMEETRTTFCSTPEALRPETAQASASLGMVSVSATWNVERLCAADSEE